jgi:hypothetical protein
MSSRPDIEDTMSPSDWLADSEVAERRPVSDEVAAEDPVEPEEDLATVDDHPLSATEFQHLARRAEPLLDRVGAAAESGSTMRTGRRRGPTWISVASPRGHGRIIRHPDGSFESSAHRSADGALVLDVRGDAVQVTDFDDLVAAVSQTAPSRPPRRRSA